MPGWQTCGASQGHPAPGAALGCPARRGRPRRRLERRAGHGRRAAFLTLPSNALVDGAVALLCSGARKATAAAAADSALLSAYKIIGEAKIDTVLNDGYE